MPRVGRMLQHRPSRGLTAVSLVAMMATVALPALATSVAVLALTLLAVGAATAALDLSMNAQGVSVERRIGRPILSSLHAAFSFGGFAGAGLGAAAAAADLAPLPHLLAAAALFGGGGLLCLSSLLAEDRDPDAGAARLPWRRLPRPLVLLGVAAFFTLLTEGAAADWSAKLVSEPLHASEAMGALAYATFSLAMGGGRLMADRLWERWGARGLVRRAGTFAAVGFGAGLAAGSAPSALAGFAALGLGLSGIVPTLFRTAAATPGIPTGTALAAVSSLGYLGFVAGPPLIGGVAELTGLQAATGLLALAAAIVVVLAPAPMPER